MNVRETIHNLQTVIAELSHHSAETTLSIRTNNHRPLTNTITMEEKDGKIVLVIDEINISPEYYDDDFFDGFPPPCCID